MTADNHAKPRVGTKMNDGTIYAGISPTTNRPMYVTPADAPLKMIFNEVAEYAKTVEMGNNEDFRLPDRAEMEVLFNNRNQGALKDTFKEGSLSEGNFKEPNTWYWTSTLADGLPNLLSNVMSFYNGTFTLKDRENVRSSSFVRLVRS